MRYSKIGRRRVYFILQQDSKSCILPIWMFIGVHALLLNHRDNFKTMNFDTICLSSFDLPADVIGQISAAWQYSQPSFPSNGVYFLQEDYLRKMAEMTKLQREAVPAFMECGAKMRGNEILARLAWHCHWMLHIASHEVQELGVPWRIKPLDFSIFCYFCWTYNYLIYLLNHFSIRAKASSVRSRLPNAVNRT